MESLQHRGQIVPAQLLGGHTPGPVVGVATSRYLSAVQGVYTGSRWEPKP